jgi:hypothetical protein
MQGGQRRDLVALRTVLGIACVALVGLMAAPAAFAGSPATDQYGSALPGGGNGNTSGSPPSGGSGTTIPVTPDSSSSGQTANDGSSGTNAKSADARSAGGSSHDGHRADGRKDRASGSNGATDSRSLSNASHSVPQIAADSAGDSWLPFFIGGMVALACAAAALVFFRNRRRTAQG